jgi:hypothetical protein
MNDNQIEQEIQAKGKTAPRVTPASIEAAIAETHYFTAAEGVYGASVADGVENSSTEPLNLLTFCVLVLRNGFTVTGESACASPENFDAEIGRKVARANAVQKIWPLEGYLLKQRLHEAANPVPPVVTTFQQRVENEKAELDTKIAALGAFFGTAVFAGLPEAERARMSSQHAAMTEYSRVLGERIAAFQ